MKTTNSRVVIGMDPHKRSATIEVMAADETILGGGRFATDADGFAAMARYVSWRWVESSFWLGRGQWLRGSELVIVSAGGGWSWRSAERPR